MVLIINASTSDTLALSLFAHIGLLESDVRETLARAAARNIGE